MPQIRLALLALAAAAALAACGDARKVGGDRQAGSECASCHGFPPPPGAAGQAANHPQNGECWACHRDSVDEDNALLADGAHLNGVAGDLRIVSACNECHGFPPPPGANGNASANHPESNSCWLCHASSVAEGNVLVEGGTHLNGTVEGTGGHPTGFVNPAVHGPAANADIASCQDCHGADYAGGTSEISCNECHGGAGFATWTANCTFCHGTQTPAWTAAQLSLSAPPEGVNGQTATTDRAVGAHQAHLTGGDLGGPVACGECHAVPSTLGHVDGTPAVALGALSSRGGATPAWSSAGTTCTTYCHGATVAGGSNKTPVWTGGASQAACGTCHGAPPPPPHPANPNCGACHTGYTGTTVNAATHIDGTVQVADPHPSATWAAPAEHGPAANQDLESCRACHGTDLAGGSSGVSCSSCHTTAGFADWQTNCTFCHGTKTPAWTSAQLVLAAPPQGVNGETAATERAVGAHQKHFPGVSTLSAGFDCGECHPSVAGLTHLGPAPADVAFGPRATTGGALPAYTPGASPTCSSTYCHGRFIGGTNAGNGATPAWTSTAALTCASCHGAPPSTGLHAFHVARPVDCGVCHDGYTSTTVTAARHVDGVRESIVRPTTGGTLVIVGWDCNACHAALGRGPITP